MIGQTNSSTQYSEYIDFISELYSLADNELILNQIKLISVPKPFQIRLKIFYSKLPLSKIKESLTRNKDLDYYGKNGASLHIKTKIGRVNIRTIDTYFSIFNTKKQNIFILISITTSDEWKVISRFIKKKYPIIVPIYLSQTELIDGIKNLQKTQLEYKLRVREIASKERITKKSQKYRKSVHEWTDEPVEEVLSKIAERNQIIINLTLGFHNIINDRINVSPTAFCKITKNSEVFVTGNFNIIWETIIPYIGNVGFKKLNLFSKRGLRDRGYNPGPLNITFKSKVLDKTEEVQRFTDILVHYPNSRHTIQHGNPYTNITIADIFDGSSFDVWAVTSDNVLIVPRLKATEAAIERLVHYIFDEFHEGIISEASSRI